MILHHMRWLAALEVVLSHIRQNMLLPQSVSGHHRILLHTVYWISGCGHAGVIVFFVLSGFLVGGKAINLFHSPAVSDEWTKFLLDRFTRIFLVLWPALLFSIVILLVLHFTVPSSPVMTTQSWGWSIRFPINADLSLAVWVGAATLLNETVFRTIHINGALWSLAYEWFYYISALAVVLLLRRVFTAKSCLVILYAGTLAAFAVFLNRNMLYLGLVWCLGATAKVAFDRGLLTSPKIRWAAMAIFLAALAVDPFRNIPDLFLGLLATIVIADRGWAEWRYGTRWGTEFSSFSYSLYVTHFPVTILILGEMYRFHGITNGIPLGRTALVVSVLTLVLTIMVAKLFSLCTEAQTGAIRDILIGRYSRRTSAFPSSATEAAATVASGVSGTK